MVNLPVASEISERLFLFLVGSGLMVFAAMAVPLPGFEKIFLGAGFGLFVMALFGIGLVARDRLAHVNDILFAHRRLRDQSGPALLSDSQGCIIDCNQASRRFIGDNVGVGLAEVFAKKSGAAARIIDRLIAQSMAMGSAEESLSLGSERVRLRVRKLSPERLIWAVEERQSYASDENRSDCVAVLTADPTGRVINANPPAVRLFDHIPESLGNFLNDAKAKNGSVVQLGGADNPQTVRVLVLRDDAGWRDIAFVPERDTAAYTEEFLARPGLLEALPVPMIKVAADGALIEANHEARSIFSLEPGPLPPLFELVEGMGRPISDWLADASNGRGLLKPEIVRAVKAGQELFLQIALGRAVEDGQTILVGILNDATELKTLEAQFVQSQKMQAIGQLAGGVAHDFNNLLTAISGHCDLLLLRHDPGDPDYADLIQISQNSNRAASLVGQLLAFSRKQNLKPQALDLRDTMSDLAHLLNRLIGERIQLDVIHAPGEQVIRADRRQMEQVIVNLVVNARDAMPDGGRISITIRHNHLTEELVRDRAHVPPGDYVVIEVQDTGTGIAPEGIAKIFEPFYTTKKTGEGTGLGLSTAYGIVKQTGGYIFVDSTLGKGTLFSLYFPVHEVRAEVEEAQSNIAAPVSSARVEGVVLLVEDEAPVRAFASRALQMRGFTVLEAENAEEALGILADHSLEIDVFVTDVVMPGMDGPTWVQKALEERPGTRTVFVSGYSEEGRIEQQSRIPNSVFLPKPFSLQQLITTVNDQLR